MERIFGGPLKLGRAIERTRFKAGRMAIVASAKTDGYRPLFNSPLESNTATSRKLSVRCVLARIAVNCRIVVWRFHFRVVRLACNTGNRPAEAWRSAPVPRPHSNEVLFLPIVLARQSGVRCVNTASFIVIVKIQAAFRWCRVVIGWHLGYCILKMLAFPRTQSVRFGEQRTHDADCQHHKHALSNNQH